MPRRDSLHRAVKGSGSIRKKTVTNSYGKEYTYYEARVTTGFDMGTGKQKQRSITGKTQKEVLEKMQKISVDLSNGIYRESSHYTLGQWLDIWVDTYLVSCKPRTVAAYKSNIKIHIKPSLGAVKLEALRAYTIQHFYNGLLKSDDNPNGLSAKSIKDIHGVLHKALKQAVANDLLASNPSENCTLPRCEKAHIKPLDEDDITNFLGAIKGNRFETLFLVALFTGMRESEILGLTWDCVDFSTDTIEVTKQLQLHQEEGIVPYELVSTKNGRSRVITAAPFVMKILKAHKNEQEKRRLELGDLWDNRLNLVFTNEVGEHLTKPTVYREYKRKVAEIGRPDARFHDLRHSYAVASIRSGDDIKTVQENLGHATASFTLDVYGHVTAKMRRESAQRMESFIQSVAGL